MTAEGSAREQAAAAAQSYLEQRFPARLAMTVMDLQPLADDVGWVVWPQSAEYIRTHDPMDFVPTQALLIRTGQPVTPLPTSLPVAVALERFGHELVT